MVASTNGEVYAPYSRVPVVVEEGFQSSEDGSEMHSPVYDGPYSPHDWLYTPGQTLPCAQLFVANWDGHMGASDVASQVRDTRTFDGFVLARPPNTHDLAQHLSQELAIHEQPVLDFESTGNRFQSTVLAPSADYTFNLPQSRITDSHFRPQEVFHDSSSSYSSRHTSSISSEPDAQQIALMSSTTKTSSLNGNTNGHSSSTRPPRREASSVVIACRQCRARKIRCDSTRPVCHNCTRRNNECEYDAVPKRRGPDKRPGTRQRSCKKRPLDSTTLPAKKKRKVSEDSVSVVDVKIKESEDDKLHALSLSHPSLPQSASVSLSASHSPQHAATEALYSREPYSPPSRRYASSIEYPESKSFVRPLNLPINRHHRHDEQHKASPLPLSPSVEYSRKSWWDNLLHEHSLREIVGDLNFLLSSSGHWLSFIHAPTFLRDLQDEHLRVRMQPALIMSALAMATLMKSSQIELGSSGRNRALYFRDNAQSLLEAACSSQSVDYTLAEAALLLALFETSSHPQYNADRSTCSLQFLDRIIQVLSLCSVDARDPDVTLFSADAVPVVYMPDNYRPPKKCCCVIPSHNGGVGIDDYRSYSSMNPPWDRSWSDAEIRKEECRRLCWTALALVSRYTMQCSLSHQEPLRFALSEPSNFALLFPGEAYERALGHEQLYGQSPKESVWAVYCRSMLLWSSSTRRIKETWSIDHRARFASNIFAETHAVQCALDMHHCNSNGTFAYMCKELLYNTRLVVTHEISRLHDVDRAAIFDRRHAEEWLFYQDQISKNLKAAMLQVTEAPGQQLSRRPFQVNWVSSQVMICLALWEFDHAFVHALEQAKTFLTPLDVLNVLWPSPAQRSRCDKIRQRLEEACATAGIPSPLPAELTLPPVLHSLSEYDRRSL